MPASRIVYVACLCLGARILRVVAGDVSTPGSTDMGDRMPGLDGQDTPDVETAMNQCNVTYRVEKYYVDELYESGSFPDEIEKTPKCFVRCVLEATRVASAGGEFDPARAAALFGQRAGRAVEGAEDMARNCTVRDETCKCERSYGFLKCLMEQEVEKSSGT